MVTTVLMDEAGTPAALVADPDPEHRPRPEPEPDAVARLPRPAGPGPLYFAASPSQEALWAGLPHRARPPVVTAALRLTGHLDTRALAAAWQAVAGRHEILRSRYLVHEGRLTQVVAAQAGPTVPISLAEVRPSQVPAAVAAEREQAFDPARGPLARLRLLRQGPGDHVAVFVLHELIADAAALGGLVAELAAAYRGVPADRPAAQYADLAAWQLQRAAQGRVDESTEYWLQRLNGAEPAVLPWDLSAPGAPGRTPGAGRALSFPLPQELSAKISEAARRHRAGVQVVGLAAFQLLLACWSGQRDITVRGPVPERARGGEQRMLGPLSHAVALRTDLTGAPAFGEVVDRVRHTSAWDFAHHEVPLEPVAAQLRRPRLVEQLGEVQFGAGPAADGPRRGAASWGGRLRAEPFTSAPAPAARPLTLMLRHDERAAHCVFTYDSSVFSEARIRQLRADYFGLLGDVADHPKARFR
ncbi:condensation domain-containing protein [Streptomyces sp. NBC_00047]|uniref:condensation domain-containing protein n=1 Tax=Streptomyces sp. NBC_00047 TaxID=2975627 RepID=UPI0022594F23|nr:condensation domain-containing protein [Streptomyces sp. NBC_00047]MCX5612865.1 condensation domain-containing protein [Streptomyces sp. NBC_00047]